MNETNGCQRKAFVEMKLKLQKAIRAPQAKVQQIFVEHCVKGRTQREVAAEFGCQYQYVSKCKQKMEKYLGETVGRAGMGDWVSRKGVVDYLQRERLTYMFGECLQGLKASSKTLQTRKVTIIEGKPIKRELWEREMPLNWKWADLAIQAAEMRTEYEFQSGACEPPAEVDVTDEEKQASMQRMLSEAVYLDRPPTEQELEDARTVHVRLEHERKLLEEERRLIAIERMEISKLKKELEGVLATAKENVGRVSLPVESSDGPSKMDGSCAAQTGRETRPTEKQKPRPQFTWRFATREDFSLVEQRRRARERIEATVRQMGFCPPFRYGPPLEVKKGVFIVAEPLPSDDIDKAKYREEYLRQEAEAKAEGRKWREPFDKFRADGMVLK